MLSSSHSPSRRNCPEVPEVPSGAACMAMDHGRRLHGIPVPEATANTAFAPAMVTCDAVKAGYEAHCCNASEAVPFDATIVSDAACFVEAGSHVVHAEAFNGARSRFLPALMFHPPPPPVHLNASELERSLLSLWQAPRLRPFFRLLSALPTTTSGTGS